ncbi:MAG: element excision factor XisH family protein [Pyrinomonadaceae bacterium]
MPARDKFHDIVKKALVKDGWTITHDPYSMKLGSADLFVDLGAEKLIAAEKGNDKIAVEVKSFLGRSIIAETQDAIGQFIMYQEVMSEFEANRTLYLAIEEEVFDNEFSDALKTLLLEKLAIKLLIFRASEEGIVKWLT